MTTMYALRPIIQSGKLVEVPKCMYEMKNIHNDGVDGHSRQEDRILSNVTEQVINFLKAPLPEVVALEKRQEKILTQLAELKQQVLSLCDVLPNNTQVPNCDDQKMKMEPVKMDMALNVNPSKPCYSVLALGKLWNDVDFPIECYVSSTSKVKAQNQFKNTEAMGKSSSIKLPIIWNENVLDTYLVLSSVHSYPIMGEVNILRYLCRLLGHEGYENSTRKIETMEIDSIFDLTHRLTHENNEKKAQMYVSLLSQKLSKKKFFSGRNQPGVADVAVWSVIKQLSPKLPQNLAAWFSNCDEIFLR